MSVSRALVNNYIAQKKSSINSKYRLKFHMSPDVGWMNDPNGLTYFNGQYHLYYQAYPYRTKPGQMMWGHFVSDDLISFKDKGIALSLDNPAQNAYSGNAIVEDGVLNIFYTLHLEKKPQLIRYDGEIFEPEVEEELTEEANEIKKHQPRFNEGKDVKEEEIYRSTSIDGEEFEIGERVFDNETLPANISQTDFRDPCIIKKNDTYYIFVGGKDINTNEGLIIVLKGKTLDKFEYAFSIGPYYEFGDMAECPSYLRIDDKDVLLVSGCNTYRRGNDFKNINCSLFVVGDIDFEKGEMKVDFIKEIDKGDCFYAPQFVREIDRAIMIGWLEMWGKKYPTSVRHHGYVGAFSIPREITIKDGDIYQWPIKEIENYKHHTHKDYLSKHSDISLKMGQNASIALMGDNGSILIENKSDGVYLDNTKGNGMYECVRKTNGSYKECDLRLLIDTSSIELFVENGKEVISTRFYIDGKLKLIPSGDVKDILVKEIGKRR